MNTLRKLEDLMLSFVEGRDRSLANAGEIEVALHEIFGEEQTLSDLSLALASYRPEGGELLYDQYEMAELMAHGLRALKSLA